MSAARRDSTAQRAPSPDLPGYPVARHGLGPVRVTGPPQPPPSTPPDRQSVSIGCRPVRVSCRLGTCLSLIILAPILASSMEGVILCALIGTALMLSTRSIRSRIEVLIGVISGMAILSWAAFVAALLAPTTALLVLVTSLAGSLLVLAMNVVTPKVRPWLSRTADTFATSSSSPSRPSPSTCGECNGIK